MTYPKINKLDLSKIEPGTTNKFFLTVVEDGLGRDITVPIFIAKGKKSGPVLGLTAAVHGNELNGIRVISNLITDISSEISDLAGTVVAVPIVNTPGTLQNQREFIDGVDLNRIMPGKLNGDRSQRFAHKFMKEVISKFQFHIDLHTASFGRINSLYVRANLEDTETKMLAQLQHPQIIVHNTGKDGSLRGAAVKKNIKSITVEVGNPQRLQKSLIKASVVGIHNTLSYLKMLPIEIESHTAEPTICQKSYWIYTEFGGILDVLPDITESFKKGDKIAIQYDVFGQKIYEYSAPEDGIVIGKSTNPVSQTGSRILHLGVVK